jgi:hypothetical protein
VPRSRFVTTTGVTFAVVAGGYGAVSCLQLLLLLTFPSGFGGVRERMAERFATAPWAVKLIATHLVSWVLFVALVSSLTLVASLALVKRKKWGRRLFILMLGVLVTWIGVAVPSLLALRPEDFAIGGSMPPEFRDIFHLVRAFTIGAGLLVMVVSFVIVLRLHSPSIRREFDGSD